MGHRQRMEARERAFEKGATARREGKPVSAKWRLLLLPVGAIAELLVLAACWLLVWPSPASAERLAHWVTSTFPEVDWYLGRQGGSGDE